MNRGMSGHAATAGRSVPRAQEPVTRGAPCRDQRPLPPGLATSRRPTTPGTSARSPTCTAAPASARRGPSCSATWRPAPRPASTRLFHPPQLAARGGRGDRRPAPDGADVVEPRPAQGLLAQPHPPRARPAPREADPLLARPLRHQQQEGRVGRAHGPAERDAANPRPRRLRRAARGDHRRPGHARLARRRDQQEGQAQRELRPRVPRAVHPGRRALHRARRPRGRPGLHRLGAAGFPRRLPGDAGLRPRPRAGRRRAQDVPRPDRAAGGRRTSSGSRSSAPRPRPSWRASSTASSSARPARPAPS